MLSNLSFVISVMMDTIYNKIVINVVLVVRFVIMLVFALNV